MVGEELLGVSARDVTGDEDHPPGEIGRRGGELQVKGPSIEPRHLEIANDEVERPSAEPHQCFFAVGGLLDQIAGVLQRLPHRRRQWCLVLHDQNSCTDGGRRGRGLAHRRQGRRFATSNGQLDEKRRSDAGT